MAENKKVNEALTKMDRKSDFYSRKYKTQMDFLESKSLLSKVRKITSYDKYALGEQLKSFDNLKAMCEYDSSINQLGVIPKIAYDVLTLTYSASVLPIVASVQPIEEQQGLVYFKQIKAWDTKGNLTADQTILDPRTGIVTPQGYARNVITAEVGATGPGFSYTFTLANLPLRGTLTVYVGPGTIYCTDDMNGALLGNGVSGTIDYSLGLVNVTFAADPGAVNILANYSINYEAATDIPQIQSFYSSTTIQAKIFALKATIGLFETYSMKKRFGLVAEEEVAKDLVSEINAEIGGDLITQMYAQAVGNTNFSLTPGTGVSWFEHKQQLLDKIFGDAGSVIVSNAGRGVVNLIIAGNSAAGTLSTLPGFEQVTDGNSIGAHLYGTLRGVPVVRVPEAAVLPAAKIICAYKGTSPFEAPAVYAPYMPLTTTTLLPMSPNPLMSQRAGAVWAGTNVLIPAFITTVTLL